MIRSSDLKFNWIKVGVLYIIFVLFTFLTKIFDIHQYGTLAENVIGFGTVNIKFQNAVTSNASIANISSKLISLTDILAYSALALMVLFAGIGVYQLIKGKSLKKVDYSLYCLAATYILLILAYFLFEHIIINCRPVMINNEYESSYPSSHTMLAIVVYSTAINQIARTFKYKKNIRNILTAICVVLIFTSVIGRLLCGVHWFTDIIGAILISIALIETYNTLVMVGDYKHQVIKLRFEDDDVVEDEITEAAEIDNSNE